MGVRKLSISTLVPIQNSENLTVNQCNTFHTKLHVNKNRKKIDHFNAESKIIAKAKGKPNLTENVVEVVANFYVKKINLETDKAELSVKEQWGRFILLLLIIGTILFSYAVFLTCVVIQEFALSDVKIILPKTKTETKASGTVTLKKEI